MGIKLKLDWEPGCFILSLVYNMDAKIDLTSIFASLELRCYLNKSTKGADASVQMYGYAVSMQAADA